MSNDTKQAPKTPSQPAVSAWPKAAARATERADSSRKLRAARAHVATAQFIIARAEESKS